ncbi:MAG: hypothetical protein WBB24_04700 [Maribacter sp.]
MTAKTVLGFIKEKKIGFSIHAPNWFTLTNLTYFYRYRIYYNRPSSLRELWTE